ncbi:hypothetical protein SAMN05216582_12541 [Selenomonas ruminantium]|uniref:Peptidase MA superfamily protein n=1 Tax=Selenomonas ruminantium TaxID=971 RepID=A0A1M6WJ23_SELRU|nr:hypothetical protein [Selenomonas ruminantium]SHK93614.1 hypothetical protein SAMN05216582_12541 [Selenomonas ruminantium]
MKTLGIIVLLPMVLLGLLMGAQFSCDMWTGQQGDAVVNVHSFGETDVEILQDVQKASAYFPQFLEGAMQLKMKRTVDVWVGADRKKYEELMTGRMHESAESARQKAQYTSGQALAGKQLCAINGDKNSLKTVSDRYSTTGHELFHQIQYELSDGSHEEKKALFWLDEGSADYVGAQLCEKLGGRSVEKWYLDARFSLFTAKQMADISCLQHISEEERLQLLNADMRSYSLSDVMTYYLLQHYGAGQPDKKIVTYYQTLKKDSAEDAFAKTFGIEMQAFLQEFVAWWQQERSRPADIKLIARNGVTEGQRQDFAAHLSAGRKWLRTHWGRDLHGDYQVVLVGSEDDFVAAMQEYAQVGLDSARQMASGSIWAENGSTIFFNISKADDTQQLIFASSSLVARLLLIQELGGEESGVEWLFRGSSYLAGVACLIESGQGDLSAYQRSWRKELRRQTPLPALDKMLTADAVRDMDKQYDSNEVARLSEYGTAELVQRYGWQSLYIWAQAARASGDGKKAFANVFGVSVTDFAAQVHRMVY